MLILWMNKRVELEEEMSELCTKPNDVFKFEKFMRKEGRDIEGGGCMKDMEDLQSVRKIEGNYGRNTWKRS